MLDRSVSISATSFKIKAVMFPAPTKECREIQIVIKEARSALESRRVSLGAHWVDSRESSLLRRLERGREIGR